MTDTATTSATLQLPEVLDLLAAAPLTEKLLNSRGTNLIIDASLVQRVGTQCVQVLLSAAAAWNAEGFSFAIANRSSGFAEGLQLLGIPSETFKEGDALQ